jgi:tRNA(Ile)-lysidine synthase
MSAAPPSLPARATPEESFLAALAAGMPASGPGGFPIVVAVSGGADSVAMLVGLVRLGIPRLVVAHAEHDLRDEASADREFVGQLAMGFGLSWVWQPLAVQTRGDEAGGEGLEARARRLRYAFLADVAKDAGARHVLVAHTADDQAETILHRILRGTGLTGLAGMRRARELCDGVALVRPLLDVSREAGRAFLCATHERWREDASNADTTHARNFLRHEVLPRCVAGAYPAAPAAIARLGSQAAAVAAAITSAAEHLLTMYAPRQSDGSVLLRTRELAGLDPHLVAEVFVALWRREGWPQRDMTAGHYAALAGLVAKRLHQSHDAMPQRPSQFPGGVTVTSQNANWLAFGRS